MERSVGHVSSPPLFIRQFQKGSSRKLGWGKKERDEQTGSGRGEVRMLEQELERLRQVANRLTDAHQEALDAVDRALEYRGEQGFLVDDEVQTLSASGHLEATLVDVRDILEGASADVRGLLEGRE